MAEKKQKYVVKGKQFTGGRLVNRFDSVTITFWAESDEEAWEIVVNNMEVTDPELFRQISKVNDNPRVRAGKKS